MLKTYCINLKKMERLDLSEGTWVCVPSIMVWCSGISLGPGYLKEIFSIQSMRLQKMFTVQ